MKLEEEISKLIEQKTEGSYWDFKQQWYEDNQDSSLLHDVICMANNLVSRDAYIIIGVEDGSMNIIGVDKDKNRKNTADLTQFFKARKFAGDIRPSVKVRRGYINKKSLDIIIIENSNKTPFYLTERYKQVKENSIYVRTEDINTPIDKTADPDKVEYLWRKRFGLALSPNEKFNLLVQDIDKWKRSPIPLGHSPDEEILYHEECPEYTIHIALDDLSKAQELYMSECIDPTPHWMNVTLCYHTTVLNFFEAVSLDGGRADIIAPFQCCSTKSLNNSPIIFYYIIKNSIQTYLSEILGGIKISNEQVKFTWNTTAKSIIVFEDQDQWNSFKLQILNTEDNSLDDLSTDDLKEIQEQSISDFYISGESENVDKMKFQAKVAKWVKSKLDHMILSQLGKAPNI